VNATALIRGVPNTFDRGLVSGPRTTINVPLARAQHETYQRHLRRAGYAVEKIPSSDDYPDCVFIEDVAVVIGSKAVVTRPGAPSRRGEVPAVAGALADRFDLTHIEEPGTMDGGDVFVVSGTVYVGLSRIATDSSNWPRLLENRLLTWSRWR
jgi:dimethylargininase